MIPFVAGAHCNDGITEFFILKRLYQIFRLDIESSGCNGKGINDTRHYATAGGVVFEKFNEFFFRFYVNIITDIVKSDGLKASLDFLCRIIQLSSVFCVAKFFYQNR